MRAVTRGISLALAMFLFLPPSGALADTTEWRDATPRSPSARGRHTLVFDTARDRVLLFGGATASGASNETWEWDGATGAWREVGPLVGVVPPALAGAGLAWDPNRGQALLAGGASSSGIRSEAWRWVSATRTWEATASMPYGRAEPGIAWDSATGRTVVYGGQSSSPGYLGRTSTVWQWDPETGSWGTMAAGPYLIRGHVMVTAPSGGVWAALGWPTELLGDVPSYGSVLHYDATADAFTELVPPALRPTERMDVSFAYDAATGVAVVFGGNLGSTSYTNVTAEQWAWSPETASWAIVDAPGPRPSPRYRSPAAYDSLRERVVLFGGLDADDAPLADTWEWDGVAGAWKDRTPQSPPARRDGAMAWSGVEGRLVLFGGLGEGDQALSDAWSWTGGTWEPVSGGPPARRGHTLTADGAGGLVLYGGVDGVGAGLADVWTYDGAWTKLADGPGARGGHGATWVGSIGRVVVFGGEGAGLLADLQAFDPATQTWSAPTSAGGPTARARVGFAWDEQRDRVVLFGGDAGGMLADTWEWDPGTGSWDALTPAVSPPARAGATLVWDPTLQKVVLFGGEGGDGPLSDSWVWDGVAWTVHPAVLDGPAARWGQAAGWDAGALNVTLFGGFDGAALLDDTHTLGVVACQTAVDCPLEGQCDAAVSCVDGACVYSSSEGKPCDDGSVCTSADTCAGGECVGMAADCDDGNPCTADGCDTTLGCTNTDIVVACDDGDPCTKSDMCQAGVCGGEATACDDGDSCTADACDPSTGACTHDALADGTVCDDGLACTTNDKCSGGTCTGANGCVACGSAADCDDGVACTADECIGGVCVHPDREFQQGIGYAGTQIGADVARAADGGSILAGSNATGLGGTDAYLVRLNAKRAVIWDWAFGGAGADTATGLLPTDDGGVIVAMQVGAPAGKEGWLARLDSLGRRVWALPLPAGITNPRRPVLVDPGVVVVADAVAGQGILFAGVSLSGEIAFTQTVAPGGATSVSRFHMYGAADGRAALGTGAGLVRIDGEGNTDVSLAGTSIRAAVPRPGGGWFVVENSKLRKTDDAFVDVWSKAFNGSDIDDLGATADGGVAVVYFNGANRLRADGSLVWSLKKNGKYGPERDRLVVLPDDTILVGDHTYSSAASKDDFWFARYDLWGTGKCGPCTGLAFDACDDPNTCTTDTCDTAKGCVHNAVSGACDDGDACTDGDTCSGGVCTGVHRVCGDGDPCTVDGCDTATGECTVTPAADGSPCEDDLACTADSSCQAGACVGTASCPVCSEASDCPSPVDTCQAVGCYGGYCVEEARTGTFSTGYTVSSIAPLHDGTLLLAAGRHLVRLGHDLVPVWQATSSNNGLYRVATQLEDHGVVSVGNGLLTRRLTVDGAVLWERMTPQGTSATAAGVFPAPELGYTVVGQLDASQGGFWLGRYDANGNLLWSKDHLPAGASSARPYQAVEEPAGTIVATGFAAMAPHQAYVARFDPTGELLADAMIAAEGDTTVPFGISRTADGGFVMVGRRSPIVGAQWDHWIVRLDADLTVLWQRTFGGPMLEQLNAVTEAPGGDLVFSGYVRENDKQSIAKLFYGRTSPNGEVLWSRTYDNPGLTDEGWSLLALPEGGLVMGGLLAHYNGFLWKSDDFGSVACDGESACSGLMPADCDDGDPCTTDDCDPTLGCVHEPTVALCPTGDGCVVPSCVPGQGCVMTAKDCQDNEPCTLDLPCDAGECPKLPNTCDDSDPCTADWCDPQLGCFHQGCDDDDPCTIDGCDPQTGCINQPRDCSDGDPCTADLCDAETGDCSNPLSPEPCDDGDPCTQGDVCEAGGCAPGAVVDCDDANPCTVDACLQAGGCSHTPKGGACDDRDACTTGDSCVGAVCTGATVTCGDGNPCTDDACDPASGDCLVLPNSGSPCEDGDLCWIGDLCLAGVCVSGAEPTACEDGDPCTVDECVPLAGCLAKPLDCDDGDPCTWDDCVGGECDNGFPLDGEPCDDGNACTEDDLCDMDTCQGGAPPVCDDGSECTVDGCNPSSGCVFEVDPSLCDDGNPCNYDVCVEGACVHEPGAGGEPCSDGNACTVGDACDTMEECVGGAPLDCGDGDPCTTEACNPALGCVVSNADGAPCDDGDACSVGDLCMTGVCEPGPGPSCDDGDPCTNDGCAALLGCTHAPATGPGCDDGDACTAGDGCEGGICKGGSAVQCDDGSPCTDDACSPAAGCLHAPVTGACNDGNPCTEGDHCQAGVCTPASGPDCDDGNPCTQDTCALDTGCVNTPLTGTACTDGDACTSGDHCSGGACVGDVIACEDGNPCTTDTCEPATGCSNVPVLGACDDGDPCTVGDACAGGSCTPGAELHCDDGDPCTMDLCGAAGCTTLLAPDGAPCDDGDACTALDACAAGACEGGAPLDCGDGDVCAQAGCDPVSGCWSSPLTGPSCDDGDACTSSDTCVSGVCTGGGPVDCANPGPCAKAECLPSAGCVLEPKDGAACDDGDPCTEGDHCLDAACVPGAPASCDDGDACTTDACGPAGCEHAPVDCDDGSTCTTDACDPPTGCLNLPNVGPCSDGDPCTGPDACTDGACLPGPALSCDDDEPCTDDTCGPEGCLNELAEDGAPCDDGDSCTVDDVCVGGICAGVPGPECDDGDPCTDDGCDPELACVSEPAEDGGACDDGDLCNGPDACEAGLCAPVGEPPCDDADPCTTDACQDGACQHQDIPDCCTEEADCAPAGACVVVSCPVAGQPCQAVPLGDCCETDAQCDDGDPCTADRCEANACAFAVEDPACCRNVLDCDDGDPCTVDACDEDTHACSWTTDTKCEPGGAELDQAEPGPDAGAAGAPDTLDAGADGALGPAGLDASDASGAPGGATPGSGCGDCRAGGTGVPWEGSWLVVLLLLALAHRRFLSRPNRGTVGAPNRASKDEPRE